MRPSLVRTFFWNLASTTPMLFVFRLNHKYINDTKVGIFITPASGIAAPQCGNYDEALVVAKSEVGRSIMAAIPTTSGMVISVGI